MDSNRIKIEDKRPLKLFFEDEASFGRISDGHRCWVPKSTRAIVKKQQIREYLYSFTTICPETGECCSIISPICNYGAMQALLDETSKEYKHYRIAMVMDGASWHKTEKIVFPENILPIYLPPYSPELNPVEHIWDYLREQKQFKNYVFKTLDAVECQMVKALKELSNEKEKVKSTCGFSWLS